MMGQLCAFGLVGAAGLSVAPPGGPRPRWEVGRTVQFAGYDVAVSKPRLVARSKGFLWFPSLVRTGPKTLFAVMSSYADEAVEHPTALFARSSDGGLTWSPPLDGPYGDAALVLRGGDIVLLPYYMRLQDDQSLTGPYQHLRRGAKHWVRGSGAVRVAGWPRKVGPLSPDLGGAKAEWKLGSFVFNGQTVRHRDGRTYLATLYGRFADTKRYSLVMVDSTDGLSWKIRSIVADETCTLAGAEGPCESALVRLKDGRLMCVYRMHSGLPYGQSYSSDEGVTWTAPVAMDGPFSVQPSLAVLPNGMMALSGGRPGLDLWINRDGDGMRWDRIDLQVHHNALAESESISPPGGPPVPNTSSYTDVVALDGRTLLVIYDRVPNGWSAIPPGSGESNSVWVVRVTIQ